MKKYLFTLAFAAAINSATFAQDTTTTEKKTTTQADGSSTTTTKTTTSTGTLTEYTPGTTFVLKETSGPVTYSYGDKVTYVTKSGKVVTEDMVKTRVKVGIPVSVQYTADGDRRMITRVVIED